MATDVLMPRLSDSMEEGTVLKWLVEQGGEVKRGEPLAEIETDKANMTYEADTDGTLIEILAGEGDTLAIGEVIARVGDPGEAASNGGGSADAGGGEASDEDVEDEAAEDTGVDESEASGEAEPAAEEAPAPPSGNGGEPSGSGGGGAASTDADGERVRASPVARRMAGEMGVELASLEGSGPGGRIVKADVEAAGESAGSTDGEGGAAPSAPAEDEPSGTATEAQDAPEPPAQERGGKGEAGAKGEAETIELTRLQKTVARRMAESKATAPDFQLQMEIDMTGCVDLRSRLKEVADPVPTFNDMIVKACALGLREHPRVNGAYRDGAFELYSRVNVGVAVAGQDALVVPTVFDAGTKSLGEIARDVRGLVEKVHEGTISPPELSGGTFTVSNLGMFGIENFTAVINPPQAAILAVGALKKKAVVDEQGRIVARDTMGVTLVSDHRILYGADAARFLARVRGLLEQPLALAL
jgi:pyruvate dehydrogenase E2 component (dihydrolipoamide acetyltransferase)